MCSSSTDTDTETLFEPQYFVELQAHELRSQAGELEEVIQWIPLCDESPSPAPVRTAAQGMFPPTPNTPSMGSVEAGYYVGSVPALAPDYYVGSAPAPAPDCYGGSVPAPAPTPTPFPPTQPQLPYVLPHAPPPSFPVTSSVQPPGDRFVESAVNNTIPTLEAWPGRHGFSVTVRTPSLTQPSRLQPYVFDKEASKLYVDMNISVTFAFRVAEGTDTSRLRVSALPVYPDMHHVNTPVRRCPTHRQPEMECNTGAEGHIDHVIRADHNEAIYQEMGTTKERRSVLVPYERPQPGTKEYRVSYKFCCMNTCVGGINRRRLTVLFTLEDSSTGEPLGRQTIEVKVCKCPHRDARADLTRRRPSQVAPDAPRLCKRRLEPASETAEHAVRRQRTGQLSVQVDDIDEYDHLVAVLASFRAIRRRRQARTVVNAQAPPSSTLAPVGLEPAMAGEVLAEEEEEPAEEEATTEVAPSDVRRRPTLPVIKMEML